MEGIITNAWGQAGAIGVLFVIMLGVWYLERKERLALQGHNRELYGKLLDLTVDLKVALLKTQEYLENQQRQKG